MHNNNFETNKQTNQTKTKQNKTNQNKTKINKQTNKKPSGKNSRKDILIDLFSYLKNIIWNWNVY